VTPVEESPASEGLAKGLVLLQLPVEAVLH
jgi:hypothetical protein